MKDVEIYLEAIQHQRKQLDEEEKLARETLENLKKASAPSIEDISGQ